MAIGQFVSSEDIAVGGHLWRVNYYPNGDSKDNDGEYVSIFLKLADKSKNVKAIFEAFMMDKDGQPSKSHKRKRAISEFPTDGCNEDWGWKQFVERCHLLPDCVADDASRSCAGSF
ncbi:hypothetical protein BAE44_0020836 [Dichanthelium oligosanthes]|uniref:MATH domain-containing protein n=1 Tax=Dichanthelium oligosanthes TaxID=888268 RepID=A0A1E5UZ92_9POAL|nr:hypothetical protein BAE44_0020836 [Dichanthelium oligosanthes]